MAFSNDEKRKQYEKNGFFPTIGIRLSKNDENAEFMDVLKYACDKSGLSVPKYFLQAVREKLEREGFM